MEFDGDLFFPGGDDSVQVWRERRLRAEPYVWLYLTRRFTARAAVRFETRKIEWVNTGGVAHAIETDYVVPSVGLRTYFGSRRKFVVETDFASEIRKRREEIGGSLSRTENFHDHRFYFGLEYFFADDKIIRIIEAIELDGEDVGEFRIHDHGFFQMIFAF